MPRSQRHFREERFRWGGYRWFGSMLSTIAVVALAGCQAASPCCRRHVVSDELQTRMGHDLGHESQPGDISIPPGVDFEDGLTVDEAVSIALWNNAAFRTLLAALGISAAQLLDAGLILDPQFTIFLPLGPKQLEFSGFQAINALWLRPIRIRAAELDLCGLSEQMVQNGLDVIRNVRSAHADLVRAERRAALMLEAQSLREQILKLTRKRVEAGDISELEAATAKVDVLQATAAAERATHDITLARERLRVLLGLTLNGDDITAKSEATAPVTNSDVESLVTEALAFRPDLRAAEIQIEAAGERLGLARYQIM